MQKTGLKKLPTEVSAEDLSRVIGLIYDCAIDVERWPIALEAMGELLGACYASIGIYDPFSRSIRLSKYWGSIADPAKVTLDYESKYAVHMPFHLHMPLAEIDVPYNTQMLMDLSGRHDFYTTPFYKLWAEPAGLKDVVTTILYRTETRFCVWGVHTPIDAEMVGPRQLATGRMFAPHVKRAALIGDMLDKCVLEANTVKSALDVLACAVVLTNGNAEIVHANAMARSMIADGDPINILFDKLSTHSDDAAHALHSAISRAATEEAAMAGIGIGIPIPFRDGRPAIAHVLPLATTAVRNRILPSATAAIFISTADAAPPPVEAISALYELTQAEQKVLGSVLAGRNQAETAKHLDIAESTVKTHLGRIFSKTRADNQSDLAKLAERLAGPGSR